MYMYDHSTHDIDVDDKEPDPVYDNIPSIEIDNKLNQEIEMTSNAAYSQVMVQANRSSKSPSQDSEDYVN